MKKKLLNIFCIFVFTMLLIPGVVSAGLYVGSCTEIPGTSGGCGGGPLHTCPNMSYDGIPVHCVEPSSCAIEGDTCTRSEVSTGSSCSACCDTPSISATPATQNLGLNNLSSNEQYYVSSAITVSRSGTSCSTTNYIPTIQQVTGGFVPAGTEIIDENGNVITGISTNLNKVFIRIPASAVTKKVNFKVAFNLSYSFTRSTNNSYSIYFDCPGQNVQSNDSYTSSSNQSISGTASAAVTITINTGDFQLTKRDVESHELLGGVQFKLYELNSNGTCNQSKEVKTADRKNINPITTKINGYVEVKNILYGNYCLVETDTLETYEAIVAPDSVAITQDINTKTIENQQIRLKISKKAITGEDELPGAIIKITDETGNILYREFESSEEPWEEVFEKGTYILTETIAPQGYMPVANSWKFNIDNVGNITVLSEPNNLYSLASNHLTIFNDTAKIYISKKNITNVEELAGAEIKIVCDNGYELEPFISGTEPKELEALPMVGGTCTLTETVAPEGYERITNSLKFQIDTNGNIRTIGSVDDFYYVTSNRIVIYNGSFPKTDVYTWVGTIIIGVGLISGGAILIIRNVRRKKTK